MEQVVWAPQAIQTHALPETCDLGAHERLTCPEVSSSPICHVFNLGKKVCVSDSEVCILDAPAHEFALHCYPSI